MTISCHAIARTRRADITPEMKNKSSQRERHNVVFAVETPIILRTSANTRILNVIDATKRGICGLSVATQDNDVGVERLKEQYRGIFKPELRTVKGVKAKLYLKENAKPVFQRARPVPYALRPAVEEELKRMESDGVLNLIEFSDWATPIVCVPKTDGSVCICGDYKGTVNPAIQTEQYPSQALLRT